jgi:hypothetical protein
MMRQQHTSHLEQQHAALVQWSDQRLSALAAPPATSEQISQFKQQLNVAFASQHYMDSVFMQEQIHRLGDRLQALLHGFEGLSEARQLFTTHMSVAQAGARRTLSANQMVESSRQLQSHLGVWTRVTNRLTQAQGPPAPPATAPLGYRPPSRRGVLGGMDSEQRRAARNARQHAARDAANTGERNQERAATHQRVAEIRAEQHTP